MPTIVNLQPSGKYLMEEFYYAGGLPVVIRAVGEMGLLHKDALSVTGDTIWNGVKDVVNYNDDVIVPHETRPKLITALETLQTKRVETPKRKHGNIPL